MFDTTRLLNYLSKPIELSNSLWPDLDRTLNEQRRNQSTSTSSHITDNQNTLEFPISEPTTPTPNCTKPQDFSTSLGEVDTSFRSLSCHSPITSSCNKEDVGQNGISPDIPSMLSNSQARLKFSSSTPHLHILNQNKDRSLLVLASNTTSSKSSCTSANQSTEGKIAFGSFDGSTKYSSRSSFDETLYVRRRRMNQFDSNPTSQWNWNSEDTEEDFENDLISDDSPIATPAVSPSPSPTTSPQPQKCQFSKSESLPKKEVLVEKVFLNDTEISSDPTKLKLNNSTPHVTGMVKVVGTTPPGNSDWSDELVGGLDFDSNDEWVNTFLSKNKCHQSSCSSFPSTPKTTSTNSTGFPISSVSLKHPKCTDDLYTKSEPRLYRAATPSKTMISSKAVEQSCINRLSLPKKKSNKQGIRVSGRYDSQVFKTPRHPQRIPNSSPVLSPSNNSQTRYTIDTRSDSCTTHTFSRNHSPRTIGKVTMSNRPSSSTRHTLDYSIDLEDDTSFESAIQEPSQGHITKSHLKEPTSPSRPSLIPYAFGEGKKAHIIGNMLFDPEKMCWTNLSDKGMDEDERNSDPFENFSSDEEDIQSIQEAQPPKEEFSVGTEFQLTAEELREMFKTEMEHKINMQRWYVNSDLYTNHDRIGYKDPIIREVELLDIRLTWPDRFQSRSSR